MREQLTAGHVTDIAIPNRVQPVTAIDEENSSQYISELVTSAGTTWAMVMLITVRRLCVATLHYNQVLNSISGSAIVNVTSDVFVINPPIHECTLPNFHDSSKLIVLHLRDLDEYYRIKIVPESLKMPLAMRAVTDPIAKSWFSTVYSELNYEHFKALFFLNFYGLAQD